MLQTLKGWFGQQSPPYDETLPEVTPKILVTVSTSSNTMSESGTTPFSITLQAVVDGDRPVTVNVFNTILWSEYPALNSEGFAFTDTCTNELAKRMNFNVCYALSDYVLSSSSSVVEIPSKTAAEAPYEVCFNFENATPHRDEEEHYAGLKVGHKYEIGLGRRNAIDWWKMGTKGEVFAAPNQKRSRYLKRGVPNLHMELVNKATFKVGE